MDGCWYVVTEYCCKVQEKNKHRMCMEKDVMHGQTDNLPSRGFSERIDPVSFYTSKTIWSLRQAQCWNDYTVPRAKDPNTGCQNWGQHLQGKHRHESWAQSSQRPEGCLGLQCEGSLTAQLFPQFLWPKHPQQSSLWSPMNTAAGMSTWVWGKQSTLLSVLFCYIDKIDKAQYLHCIHLHCLLAVLGCLYRLSSFTFI